MGLKDKEKPGSSWSQCWQSRCLSPWKAWAGTVKSQQHKEQQNAAALQPCSTQPRAGNAWSWISCPLNHLSSQFLSFLPPVLTLFPPNEPHRGSCFLCKSSCEGFRSQQSSRKNLSGPTHDILLQWLQEEVFLEQILWYDWKPLVRSSLVWEGKAVIFPPTISIVVAVTNSTDGLAHWKSLKKIKQTSQVVEGGNCYQQINIRVGLIIYFPSSHQNTCFVYCSSSTSFLISCFSHFPFWNSWKDSQFPTLHWSFFFHSGAALSICGLQSRVL